MTSQRLKSLSLRETEDRRDRSQILESILREIDHSECLPMRWDQGEANRAAGPQRSKHLQ